VSWFHRYAGEWAVMTDEQKFERLKAYNQKQCKPPKPEQELVDIWEWIKQKHTGHRQEQWDKREDDRRDNGIQSNPVIISHLSGNMYYQVNNNPPTFIMADKKVHRLIEITFRTSQTRNAGESVTLRQTIHTKPYLACIPDKVIKALSAR
jgi:hypothetical protein